MFCNDEKVEVEMQKGKNTKDIMINKINSLETTYEDSLFLQKIQFFIKNTITKNLKTLIITKNIN